MKSAYRSRRFFSAIAAVSVAFVFAQSPALPAQQGSPAKTPLEFEAATVKPDEPGKMITVELRVYPGGRLVIHGHDLRELVAEGFDLPAWEVIGGEKWVGQLRFDIEGKPPEDLRNRISGGEFSNFGIQDARVRSMLQALLLERFHLKYHIESRPGTVYLLKRSDGPLRLKGAEMNLYTRSEDGTVSPE
jgi:uncharacterized protein (TIGR03435 family)